MGALISFELVRMLQGDALARSPLRLIVSGRRAPQLIDRRPPTYHLPEEDFIAELRRLKGTPEAVLTECRVTQSPIATIACGFRVV